MELTPRTFDDDIDVDAAPGGTRRPPVKRRWALVVVVLVVAALGVVAWQGLTNASEFFYNADEAVAERAELGERRFRLQGTVLGDTIERVEGGASFTVSFNGVDVDVVHRGGTPELFQDGIPVVMSGRWDGEHFASDEILVKHDEQYEADNGERIADAQDGRSNSTDT